MRSSRILTPSNRHGEDNIEMSNVGLHVRNNEKNIVSRGTERARHGSNHTLAKEGTVLSQYHHGPR